MGAAARVGLEVGRGAVEEFDGVGEVAAERESAAADSVGEVGVVGAGELMVCGWSRTRCLGGGGSY